MMDKIVKGFKIALLGILALFYWPLNMFYLWFQKHYRKWQVEDRISFYAATPLYYLLFLIVVIVSVPMEKIGEGMHPPLPKFR